MLKKVLLAVLGLIASIGVALAAVNINTASESDLDSLPGVGPAKAKAIIDYRKANGGFKSVEDIKNVKGIGDATFEKLKSQITVSGANTPVSSDKPAKAEKKADKDQAKADKKAEKEAAKADKQADKGDKKVKKDKAADASSSAKSKK